MNMHINKILFIGLLVRVYYKSLIANSNIVPCPLMVWAQKMTPTRPLDFTRLKSLFDLC